MQDIDKENKSVYRVQGFTCANCAATFERNVKALPHVHNAQVNFGASKPESLKQSRWIKPEP
jgi:Cd2+/Zn2+-exporting ATPase